MGRRRLLAGLLAAGALAAACSSTTREARSAAAPLWVQPPAKHPVKVLVVVEENHTARSALLGMPYLAGLAAKHGRATRYRALTHPSLPNYLAIAGGSTFGVRDGLNPASHPIAGPSVFDRVIASGRTAKTYAEAMPTNCALSNTARYAVRHNPWPYFSDAGPRANCRRFNVPSGTPSAGALRRDIDAGRLPNVGLLIPDVCNDAHDCSLGRADAWLRSWLTVVQNGPDYKAGRLAIVVTFDEDDSTADNTILTVVISPYTSKVVSDRALTHYSLTRYFAELTSTAPMRAAATAPSLRNDFHI